MHVRENQLTHKTTYCPDSLGGGGRATGNVVKHELFQKGLSCATCTVTHTLWFDFACRNLKHWEVSAKQYRAA